MTGLLNLLKKSSEMWFLVLEVVLVSPGFYGIACSSGLLFHDLYTCFCVMDEISSFSSHHPQQCFGASLPQACLASLQNLPSPLLTPSPTALPSLSLAYCPTLARFMQRACLPGGRRRPQGSGASSGWRSATVAGNGGTRARFGFQTPPRGFVDGSSATAGAGGSVASDINSPTSFSGMINRFFNSNPGVEGGGVVDVRENEVGGDGADAGVSSSAAAAAVSRTAAVSDTAALGASGGFHGKEAFTSPTTGKKVAVAPTAGTTTVKYLGATMVGAKSAAVTAAVTEAVPERGAGIESPQRDPSPLAQIGRRKTPNLPPAKTPSTDLRDLGSVRGSGGGGGGDMNARSLRRESINILPGMFSSNNANDAGNGKKVPGIFSDDESETGHSTDQESYAGDDGDGGGGGGGRYSGYGRYEGYDETVGAETKRNVVSGRNGSGSDGNSHEGVSRKTKHIPHLYKKKSCCTSPA